MKKKVPDKARQIAADLAGMPLQEAAIVLTQAQLLILGAAPAVKEKASAAPTAGRLNPLLRRRPDDKSIIGRYPEIIQFLNGLDRYHTLGELVDLCRERFGPMRGLSRTSIHRYIQRRTREACGQRRRSQ